MRTVADVGERGLLAAIAARLARGAWGGEAGRAGRRRGGGGRARGGTVLVGVGDDAALLSAVGPAAVLTTDLLVEGVDFEWSWARPADVGHKAAAVNLSDLAAMGARPRALLLSLALRAGDRVRDVLTIVGAVHALGARFGAPLVGGDLSATRGPFVLSVTAIGEVDPRRALLRKAAREGDRVLVSGTLGGAAAGLDCFLAGIRPPRELARRQLRPEPRVALGRALVRSRRVHSCADVSDGLASDVLHLVPRGLGVELDPARLPRDRALRATARALGRDPDEVALSGGEDFELVLAAAARDVPALTRLARSAGTTLTDVGVVRTGEGLVTTSGGMGSVTGFDHFRKSKARRKV